MIISAEVAIGIESFTLIHQGEEVSNHTVPIDYSYYEKNNLGYQLIPIYLPSVAQVDGFIWTSDNEKVATVNSEGIVSFKDCGFAKISAVCKNDKSIRSSCSFYVEDSAIHSLSLYSYETDELLCDETELRKYDTIQLRTDVNPYVALDGDLTYASSNEAVAKVDANGIVTAVDNGNAIVTVTAKGKEKGNKNIAININVVGTALTTSKEIYAFGNSIDLSNIIVNGNLTTGVKVCDLTHVNEGNSITVQVTDGVTTEDLKITKLGHEKTLGVKEMPTLLNGEWKTGEYIAVGANKTITPIDLLTGEVVPNVRLFTSNPTIIRVNGSKIQGVAAGKATITLTASGYEDYRFTITCATPVNYFALNFDSDNDRVGLGVDRVFGTQSYYDGVLVNGIKVSVDPQSVQPADSNQDLFIFETDSQYAMVDANGLVTFTDEAVGKEVKVTVKSLFSTSSLTRTYTFKNIVKGVNVGFGLGANAYDAKKNVMPKFEPYYDMLKVTNMADSTIALVFQTNIYLPTMDVVDRISEEKTYGKFSKLSFVRDVYGNGYKIDGQLYLAEADKDPDGYELHIIDSVDDEDVKDVIGHKVKVNSLYIQSFAPTSGDSEDSFTDLMRKGGTPIRICLDEADTEFDLDFEFCVFQYAYVHVVVIGGDVKFDGCIFRNSVGPALNVSSLRGRASNVVVNNCLFSNTLSSVAMISNGRFPSNNKEPIQYNSITWTGVNYIYNWKKVDEIRMDIIPDNLLKNDALNKVVAQINGKLTESARNSFIGKDNDALTMTIDGNKYVNFGVLCLSAWSEIKLIENAPREKVTDGLLLNIDDYSSCIEFKIDTTNMGSMLLNAVKSVGINLTNETYMIINKNSDGVFSTAPKEKYNLDEKTYSKLRGKL